MCCFDIPEDVMDVLNPNHVEIRKPNWMLNKEEKKKVSKKKAEVSTPHFIVRDMVRNVIGSGQTYLEITCGDCPFIADRYDRQTGETIRLDERSGILDLMLKQIPTFDDGVWKFIAQGFLQRVFGYELDESLLVLGRINVLLDVLEWCPGPVYHADLMQWAFIIERNFIQMDGLTGLDKNGRPACFWDWDDRVFYEYNELKGSENAE